MRHSGRDRNLETGSSVGDWFPGYDRGQGNQGSDCEGDDGDHGQPAQISERQ